MLSRGKLLHVHPNLGEKIGCGHLLNAGNSGTQGDGLLVLLDVDLNLSINLGELRFQELQLIPQDAQQPAVVLGQASLQGQLHLGQLGPQLAAALRTYRRRVGRHWTVDEVFCFRGT